MGAAASAGTHHDLVAAVQSAYLVDVLRGDGSFTVFATTVEVFVGLSAGAVESLPKTEKKIRGLQL
ncbi:MAG: hypothetical protein CMQ14_10680 [Gammaproteobacteria bacterium]|nr:hypothetical protein [Gammaproteobacteria bacterium]